LTSHRLEVRAGTSVDTRGSDILVMTASQNLGAGLKNRMDLVTANSALMRRLVPRLAELSPDAIFINQSAGRHHPSHPQAFGIRQVEGHRHGDPDRHSAFPSAARRRAGRQRHGPAGLHHLRARRQLKTSAITCLANDELKVICTVAAV
jgi:hypothetical protein